MLKEGIYDLCLRPKIQGNGGYLSQSDGFLDAFGLAELGWAKRMVSRF